MKETPRMMTSLGVLAAVFFTAGQLEAQGRRNSSTEARQELHQAFQAPPAEFRPLIITHSMPLGRADATDTLATRRAGGAVIDVGVTPGSKDEGSEPWNNPTYLNDPVRFQQLRDAMTQLTRRGYRVWIYDELGYPSGSAGGRVLDGHPEFGLEVVGCRTMQVPSVSGDAERHDRDVQVAPELGRVVACYALPCHNNVLDLEGAIDLTATAQSGKFQWNAPSDGQWSVCLFERFQPDTWRRHNIPRRNVNILDRNVVSRFIELTHTRYANELGRQLADVDLFFTDEPQFGSAEHWSGGNARCVPMIQWCDELPIAFQKRNGYDLIEVLPALFHPVGRQTCKFRYDFYALQSDLVAENYYGQIEEWCHQHAVASSGHMLLEESLLLHLMFSGSMMKNWARMDLPGVDLLGASAYKTMAGWEQRQFPVAEDYSCKMASSVAHLTGKQGVFSESFALARKVPLGRILGVAAWQLAGGVTHMCTYTIQQELSADDYARFSDFVGRITLLTRRGQHVADIAVLVPEASVWASYTPPDQGRYQGYFAGNAEPLAIDRVFRETCYALASNQRDFDCLSEQLLDRAQVDDGCLLLGGERFRLLVLPEMRMVTSATLKKVQEFLQAGGTVAFVGSLPCQTPSRGDDPQATEQVNKLLAEFSQQAIHVSSAAQDAELIAWINRRVPGDLVWHGPRTVRMLRRQEPSRMLLLVANPSRQDAAGTLTVPQAGAASVWNPETGAIQAIDVVSVGQQISLQIPAESARLLVVERE